MTIDNWLMIAVIISTLIAPTVGNLFPPRAQTHPTLTPEANHPKNRTQRIWERWVRFANSPWILPPFVVVSNISALLLELHLTTPVTRRTIFQISADVAAIWYGVVLFFLNLARQQFKYQEDINRSVNEANRGLLDIVDTSNRAQSELNREILDLIKSLANDLHVTKESLSLVSKSLVLDQRVQTELDERKHGALTKMLVAIKNLFG